MNFARSTSRAARPALGLFLLSAGALVLIGLGPPGVARAEDYPRLGLYGSMAGDGYPYWVAGGAFQDTTFDAVARYHEVILDASPISEYRPEALAELRAGEGERIVLDPPRTGAGREVVEALVARRPAAIAYVSCDPPTLGRDLALFAARGYRPDAVHLFDQFPKTFHMETVVRLRPS